jgi:hypothetical protein
MHTYSKVFGSLVVGLFGLLVVGIGVTELLDPYVWPSLMLGIPAGLVAGVALVPLTYWGLTYWEEQRASGTASVKTIRRFWTTAAAVVGFVVGGGLVTMVLWTQATGLATAMLFAGFPAGLVASALAGYFVYRRDWRRPSPPGSPVE